MIGRVIVVGSVNVDLVVVAARLPAPGETVTGGDVARHHGGKGGNQAVAAARLGAQVAFVGAVGRDDFGTAARAALEAEGIDVTHLAAVARPTGVALIVVDARAENLIAVAPGANASPTAASVTAALTALAVSPGDVVLVCREIPPDAVRAALATARAAGAIGVLNPAPADGLDSATIALADVLTPNETELTLMAAADAADAADAGNADAAAAGNADAAAAGNADAADAADAGNADAADAGDAGNADAADAGDAGNADAADAGDAGNADAADAIDGASAGAGPGRGGPDVEATTRRLPAAPGAAEVETSARRLLAGGPGSRAVVVTLGSEGALVVPATGPAVRVPAVTVVPVDTTGAGDTFSGALAVGLAAGLPLAGAVRRAVAAAGLSTTRAGARGGMPTAAEMAAFLGE